MVTDLTTPPVDRQKMDISEHQTIEYKQIWKDEYLKWVCGFANAERLLEEIPNKVRDILQITAITVPGLASRIFGYSSI